VTTRQQGLTNEGCTQSTNSCSGEPAAASCPLKDRWPRAVAPRKPRRAQQHAARRGGGVPHVAVRPSPGRGGTAVQTRAAPRSHGCPRAPADDTRDRVGCERSASSPSPRSSRALRGCGTLGRVRRSTAPHPWYCRRRVVWADAQPQGCGGAVCVCVGGSAMAHLWHAARGNGAPLPPQLRQLQRQEAAWRRGMQIECRGGCLLLLRGKRQPTHSFSVRRATRTDSAVLPRRRPQRENVALAQLGRTYIASRGATHRRRGRPGPGHAPRAQVRARGCHTPPRRRASRSCGGRGAGVHSPMPTGSWASSFLTGRVILSFVDPTSENSPLAMRSSRVLSSMLDCTDPSPLACVTTTLLATMGALTGRGAAALAPWGRAPRRVVLCVCIPPTCPVIRYQ
jgi:hypothetical protein